MDVKDKEEVLPQRSMRIDNELWEAAMAKAKADGLTLSQVIRHLLKGYVEGPKPKRRRRPTKPVAEHSGD